MRKTLIVGLLLVLTTLLASCNNTPGTSTTAGGEGGEATTTAPSDTTAPDTTQAPDTTEATDTTQPSDTTVAPEDEEDSGISPTVFLVIIGIVVLLIVLGWLLGRSRKPPVPVAAAPTSQTWQDHLRAGYQDARWLYDGMNEDVAIWRGNTMADPNAAGASTDLADRWNQVDPRMNRARDNLYSAEASAPDQHTADTIRGVITSLNGLRSAVDARANARFQSAQTPDDPGATERERIASTNLAQAKANFGASLTAASALIGG